MGGVRGLNAFAGPDEGGIRLAFKGRTAGCSAKPSIGLSLMSRPISNSAGSKPSSFAEWWPHRLLDRTPLNRRNIEAVDVYKMLEKTSMLSYGLRGIYYEE